MATRREALGQLRGLLEEALASAETKELAALSREMRMVLAELDALPEPGSKAPADEIAKRREERRKKAAG